MEFEDFARGHAQFKYGVNQAGLVQLGTKSDGLVPLSRPTERSLVDAVFCPAHYELTLAPANFEGNFLLSYQNGFFQITSFHIFVRDKTQPALPNIGDILTKRFFAALIKATLIAGRVQAEWFPPKSPISEPGIFSAVAGEDGFIRRARMSPTGGRGKSRKQGRRSWNHPEEIQRTVGLMCTAEELFNSPEYLSLDIDLSTKAKREEWVADKTQIWSVGTVHVQLSLARKLGLIESGRKRK